MIYPISIVLETMMINTMRVITTDSSQEYCFDRLYKYKNMEYTPPDIITSFVQQVFEILDRTVMAPNHVLHKLDGIISDHFELLTNLWRDSHLSRSQKVMLGAIHVQYDQVCKRGYIYYGNPSVDGINIPKYSKYCNMQSVLSEYRYIDSIFEFMDMLSRYPDATIIHYYDLD